MSKKHNKMKVYNIIKNEKWYNFFDTFCFNFFGRGVFNRRSCRNLIVINVVQNGIKRVFEQEDG